MAVHSEPLRDGERIPRRRNAPWNKLAAIIAWLLGAGTTYLFVSRVTPGASTVATLIVAGIAQLLLTLAELPLFRLVRRHGGRVSAVPLTSLLADTLLNAAGIYPYTGRIQATDLGVMLSEVFHVQPAMDPTSAFAIAFVAGLIVAGLPELLWEND